MGTAASPFPGMDPYLERHWRDVHADLVTQSRSQLNRVLPGDLVARVEERVVIDSVDYQTTRAIYPDARVFADPKAVPSVSTGQSGTAVMEPIILEQESEEHVETYVTILDGEGGELITVVEFLSPTNKLPGLGRDQYRQKRSELLAARVNFVEVDLVRQGPWRELLVPLVAPLRTETAYRAIVRRAHPRLQVELYPLSIRSPLPGIPVPLREGEEDVALDLQGLLEHAYREGRYDHTDYNQSCHPALDADDAYWADELLRKAGRRTAT
jgi:hypothetical protein